MAKQEGKYGEYVTDVQGRRTIAARVRGDGIDMDFEGWLSSQSCEKKKGEGARNTRPTSSHSFPTCRG